MGVVGVVDISVAFGRFRNVDLFQRGFYNMKVYFNIVHAIIIYSDPRGRAFWHSRIRSEHWHGFFSTAMHVYGAG
jgi:hypothetical protein